LKLNQKNDENTIELIRKLSLFISGGDGGELNFPRVESQVWLVLKLLEQIMAIGETAKKITENIKDNCHQPEGTIV
jgi:uncharacterized protein with HEPN domain